MSVPVAQRLMNKKNQTKKTSKSTKLFFRNHYTLKIIYGNKNLR